MDVVSDMTVRIVTVRAVIFAADVYGVVRGAGIGDGVRVVDQDGVISGRFVVESDIDGMVSFGFGNFPPLGDWDGVRGESDGLCGGRRGRGLSRWMRCCLSVLVGEGRRITACASFGHEDAMEVGETRPACGREVSGANLTISNC